MNHLFPDSPTDMTDCSDSPTEPQVSELPPNPPEHETIPSERGGRRFPRASTAS